jgi:fatty acid desaturase
MAAMTLAAPVALAPARFSKVVRRRSAVTGKVTPASASRGAVQVRAAIAMPNPGTPVTYNETGKWRETFDLAAWASEVRAVEKELKADIDQDDVKHLNKILTWANAFYFGGLAILFATPFLTNAFNAIGGVNPIAAFCMSTAICARWTMVGHHVCHGGYNTAQSENGVVTGRFHRRTFAKGLARRITDWMDWMMPEAWDVEHNHLHHYQLGESADPDLVERNMTPLRTGKLPMIARYGQVVGLALIWKWFYYAPNTMKEMYGRREREAKKNGEDFENPFQTGELPSTVATVAAGAFKGQFAALIETAKCFAPYATFQFAVLPAIGYAVGGASMAGAVLATSILADVMTNIHSFIIIATNHVGDDIYRFETETKPRSDDFYLRAVIGSANFRTGGDVNDFFHGWLNYQIEHHMFPGTAHNLYPAMAPIIKEECAKEGIPYNGFDGYFGLLPITARMFAFLGKMAVNPAKTK